MSIPETFSYIDLDGQTRTEPLRLMPNGRVTPLTPAAEAAQAALGSATLRERLGRAPIGGEALP